MSSLVRFLHARIDEDEAGAHLGQWPARRMLDECASKRAVLKALEQQRRDAEEDDAWEWLDAPGAALSWLMGDSAEDKAKETARGVLLALALPYSWHPDYRPELWNGKKRRR